MNKLKFTKDEVYADFEDAPISYNQQLLQDWLTMHSQLSNLNNKLCEALDEMQDYYRYYVSNSNPETNNRWEKFTFLGIGIDKGINIIAEKFQQELEELEK